MSRKTSRGTDSPPPASLVVPIAQLRMQLATQVERGRTLLTSLSQAEKAELEEDRWVQFSREILRRAFSTNQYEQEFWGSGGFGTSHEDPYERLEVLRERMERRLNALESISERLDLFGAESGVVRVPETLGELSAFLHKSVIQKCGDLFDNEHYAHAVETGFKVVRDRLRALSGYEKGSEAFGKTKLHVKGAIAEHVDADFQNGVKFLTMAIDNFRNEKSHSSEIGIDEPTKAIQYLVLCSLAMRLLDSAEILP